MKGKKLGLRKWMGMAMAVTMLSSAVPVAASAAELDELSAGDLMFKTDGFVSFDKDKKYVGTATPHDGLDGTDETFLKDKIPWWYGVEIGEEFWLKGISYVEEGSKLYVTLQPDYTGTKDYYIDPIVYMLDDDGHIAYLLENVSLRPQVTKDNQYIIDFNNIDPFKPLGSASNEYFQCDYSGVLDPEKLIFCVEVYQNEGEILNEQYVNCYNFMIAKDSDGSESTPTKEETKEPEKETPSKQEPASTATANGKKLEVKVNGKDVIFEAYEINGNNYMKLRDVAQALTDTDKHFNVTWDNEKKVINLLSATAYDSVGGELPLNKEQNAAFSPKTQTAALNTSMICVDGKEVSLTAYNIGGNNYFKLRDIANTFDFGITYDSETKAVGVDTSKPYAE